MADKVTPGKARPVKTTVTGWRAVAASLALGLACVQPTQAQMNGGGQMWGEGAGFKENQKPSYICFRTMGTFYKNLAAVYSVQQNSEGYYYGTTYNLDLASEASKILKEKYDEVKRKCQGLEEYYPATVFSDYLRGFNFNTGQFYR